MGSWHVYTNNSDGELRSVPLTSRDHAIALACALCDSGLDVLRIEAPDGSALSSKDIARKPGKEDDVLGFLRPIQAGHAAELVS